ncbi:MAG: threonylcarbamoyl-AMP synthase [Cyclobacteriaceae bacterium]|nr:threonylcarbamoyl-AMP synthase [Cyclobacteriaceae bacterium]
MAEIGSDLQKAIALLQSDELVGIPTETVYGLAGNALSTKAIAKIFEAKDRPFFDPLIVHVSDIEAAYQYVTHIPEKALQLAEHFWPGPLTLLLPKKPIIPDLATSGLDTVGIRCPQHPLTTQLLKLLPFPLAAPSANPFGYISPTNPQHVNQQLGNKIKYILDGGECYVGLESTIIGFEQDQPIAYRLGGLSIEQLEEIVGPIQIQLNTSSNPAAPGQLKSHYAPAKKLVIGNLAELVSAHSHQHIGILAFNREMPGIEINRQRILSPTSDLSEAAQHLFAYLRELDQLSVDVILTEEVPPIGLGRAINDRLKRASVQ